MILTISPKKSTKLILPLLLPMTTPHGSTVPFSATHSQGTTVLNATSRSISSTTFRKRGPFWNLSKCMTTPSPPREDTHSCTNPSTNCSQTVPFIPLFCCPPFYKVRCVFSSSITRIIILLYLHANPKIVGSAKFHYIWLPTQQANLLWLVPICHQPSKWPAYML